MYLEGADREIRCMMGGMTCREYGWLWRSGCMRGGTSARKRGDEHEREIEACDVARGVWSL